MDETGDVIIVGGGPAGSSAATHLARRGHVVHLIEKERMPRDKLCGEFLSTEVAETCRRLGVLDRLFEAGAREIRRVRVTSARGGTFETSLPGSALGISRRTLDRVLFERAAEAGAHVHEGSAARAIEGCLDVGFTVSTDDRAFSARVVLGAYGRRNKLDRRLRQTEKADRSPYVAFKAHFVGLDLADRIELHAFPGGYCGLVSEDHGEINACWISHRRLLKESGGTPQGMLGRVLTENPVLADRFASLIRTGGYVASSQLVFHQRSLFADDVCLIGDAAGMIAPLCGDGMAMAMTAAEMAASLAHEFVCGRLDAHSFRAAYVRSWRRRFRRRMALGRLLHAGYVRPVTSELGIRAACVVPPLGRALIRATRG